MISCSVTQAVYQCAGKPALDKPVNFEGDSRCGACLHHSPTAPASRILTSQFGSWDSISSDPHDGTRRLCAACAHAYRVPSYRWHPAIITPKGMTTPGHADLIDILSKPLPGDVAVVVPVSGKKLLVPLARWGYLTTDTQTFTWTARHKRLLKTVIELREFGTPEGAFVEASPPFVLFTSLPPHQHDHVRDLWRILAPLRADKALLPMFVKLSRKDKT